MLRQYHPPGRFRHATLSDGRTVPVGTVDVGAIVYIQDRLGRYDSPTFRNPWQVLAFHNREYHPCVKGRPRTTYMRGGDIATVKSLRDGRVAKVATHIILACDDEGWVKHGTGPSSRMRRKHRPGSGG